MIASELNGAHLGRKITVNDNNLIAASGTLQAVSHEAELLEDRPMFSPSTIYTVGRAVVVITLVPNSIIRVRPAAEVELLDV